MSELCRLRRSEGYGGYDDDMKQNMTPKRIVEAYQAAQKLSGNDFPYCVSREIAALRAYQAERNEKMGQTAEIDLPAVDLSGFTETLQISADSLEALEGIVAFEKKGERA